MATTLSGVSDSRNVVGDTWYVDASSPVVARAAYPGFFDLLSPMGEFRRRYYLTGDIVHDGQSCRLTARINLHP